MGEMGEGVDTKVYAGMISPPEAEKEGWLDGLWKLHNLGSEDVLTPVILPEEMRWIDSAAGAATIMAKWIDGWERYGGCGW